MSNNHPDAQFFPHATGLAETLVREHEKEEPLKLYAGWFWYANSLPPSLNSLLVSLVYF